MIEDVNSLPDDPALLKKLLTKQAARLMFLEEQFRLAQQQRFGASSENHPAQGDLFNEAEAELDVVEEAREPPVTTAKKSPFEKNCPQTYRVKLSFMILKTKPVDAVVMNYIRWAMSAAKNWSSFQLKSK